MINDRLTEYQETHEIMHNFMTEMDNLLGQYHHETFSGKELQQIAKDNKLNVTEYFVHEDASKDYLNAEYIDQVTKRMNMKLALLKNSDSYYLYLNKARDIEKKIRKTGIQRPNHAAFILHP
jgi:Cys-tRNA synthase (O-phospho-L-seryl-tRNA:Cys-tRNA synthase)